MKILTSLSFCLALATASLQAGTPAAAGSMAVIYDTPAKTVIIKNPSATNIDKFFSSATSLNFEVYKPGSKADVDNMVAALKKDAAVESVNAGVVTGDYYAFTIVLKSTQSKSWFMSQFKNAGLNNIKINNNQPVEVDKL